MSSSSLQKFNTLDSRTRKLLKEIIGRVDTSSLDIMSNPVFQSGRNFISQMMNKRSDLYQNFEAPYRRQYREQIVPGIAEQFSAYDAQDSSAFRQALSQSAADLEGNIAGMRQNAMEGAAQQALGYAQAPGYSQMNMVNAMLGNPSYAYQAMPGVEGWGQGLFGGLAGGAGSLMGSYAMNKMSEMMSGGGAAA